MRLLIDALHPAHVHVLAPLARQVLADGGAVLFAGRRKDVTVPLLEASGLPFEVLSGIGGGVAGLARELVARSAALARLCRRFRPDVLVGVMGPCIAPVGRLLGIPTVVLYDTETAVATNSWVFPLATVVATPSSWRGRPGSNHRCYDGTQELAYLHPARFTADPEVPARYGLVPPYAVVRFVSFEASHDLGDRGLADRRRAVAELGRRVQVAISAERPLPEDLAPLALRAPPEELHHVLAGAALVLGEGATTAAEAAVLGTPAVFVHTARLGYMDELERRFGLLYRREEERGALRLALDLVEDPQRTADVWERRRRALLDASVDVTAWLDAVVREVAGHPGSGHPGSGHPGSGHPGSGHPGSGHPGSGLPG